MTAVTFSSEQIEVKSSLPILEESINRYTSDDFSIAQPLSKTSLKRRSHN